MSALILDAGAFVAVDRGDRSMLTKLRVAQQRGIALRSNAVVVAQVWRSGDGRQVSLARLLRGVDVATVDEELGRRAGVLIGRARTSDPIDATLVLTAQPGDRILTGDPADIGHLVTTAGVRVVVVSC
ncbi:MAG: hypothetical protein ACRDPW_03140 [Mycobacteriales bacterium]